MTLVYNDKGPVSNMTETRHWKAGGIAPRKSGKAKVLPEEPIGWS